MIAVGATGIDLRGAALAERRLDRYGSVQVMASSGIGYEITRGGNQRRHYGFVTGRTASADRHLTSTTLGRLRETCRMYDRESTLFGGLVDRALDNIFGANFDFVPRTGEKALDQRVKAYIATRMDKRYCDASRTRHFADLARTALRGVWVDGDSLWAQRSDGSVLAFEADQVVTPSGGGCDKRIVLGVELDECNAPRAYHVQQRRTKSDHGGLLDTDRNTRRVAAGYGWLPAYRTRYHQTRGVPFLARVLSFYDRLHNYIDYESLAAEINSMLGWKIVKNGTTDDWPGVADNDEASNDTFEKVQKMEPGQVFDLRPGEDVDMIGSSRPGSAFDAYILMACRIIGVAIGMPLELVLLDFSRTNYSSARASLGEARRMFRTWQRFAEVEFCMPWYRWQIARGVASGVLPADAAVFGARCQWPAWEYIDPLKEAQGNAVAISTATKSISECIRERGQEPAEVREELKRDVEWLREVGIALPTVHIKVEPENQSESEAA